MSNRGHIFAFTCVRDALLDISNGRAAASDVERKHAWIALSHLMEISSRTNYDACKGRWLGGDIPNSKDTGGEE